MFLCCFQAKFKQIIAEAQSSTTRGTKHILQNLSLSLLLDTTVLLTKLTHTRLENMVIAKYVIGERQDISIIMLCFSDLTLMIRLILNYLAVAVNIYSTLIYVGLSPFSFVSNN